MTTEAALAIPQLHRHETVAVAVPTPTLVSPTSNKRKVDNANEVVLSPITPYSPGTAPPQTIDEAPNAPRKKPKAETATDTTDQTQNGGESLEEKLDQVASDTGDKQEKLDPSTRELYNELATDDTACSSLRTAAKEELERDDAIVSSQ